ncbi:MAG: hypothetical protein M1819_001146 [Sarea resinae]|nr:MAG: hypothetical protein M1819_001146 [Sarea resinae]
MRLEIVTTLLLPLFLATATALSLHITIPASPQLPSPAALPSSTRLLLSSSGKEYSAPISRRGDFTLRNVTAGSYLLTVSSADVAFAPLRVDVGKSLYDGEKWVKPDVEAWTTFLGNEWDNKGEKRSKGTSDAGDVIELAVLAKKEYYVARAGFSVISLFKNPMIILGLFSMALIFGMPYIMENMDPEMKSELEARQKETLGDRPTPAQSLQNFDMAAWMAGSGSSSPRTGGAGASGNDREAQQQGARRRG